MASRHLLELSALLLFLFVGIGLVAAFIVGLLLIWGRRPNELHEYELDWAASDEALLDSEPFSGPLDWPLRTPTSPFDRERE